LKKITKKKGKIKTQKEKSLGVDLGLFKYDHHEKPPAYIIYSF